MVRTYARWRATHRTDMGLKNLDIKNLDIKNMDIELVSH